MSWLTVNLNDSLNSLKGQLSSLASDVLTEGLDDDKNGFVAVPQNKVKELETLVELHKEEIEELKRDRAELEERLHACDLQAAHQTHILRQQLHAQEQELLKLRETSVEWGWEDDGDQAGVRHNHHHHLAQWGDGALVPSPPAATPVFSGQTTTDQQDHVCREGGRRREQELESQVAALRDAHQVEVAALQDQHLHTVHTLTQQLEAAQGKARTPHYEDDLHNTKAEQAEEVKRLEQEIIFLGNQCALLQAENEQHAASLEELDEQNQAAIEQILKKKDQLQEEAKTYLNKIEELTANKLEIEIEKDDLQNNVVNLKQELQEVLSHKINNKKILASSVSHIENLTREIGELKEENKVMLQLRIDLESLACAKLDLENKITMMLQEKADCNIESKLDELTANYAAECQTSKLLKINVKEIESEFERQQFENSNLENQLKSVHFQHEELEKIINDTNNINSNLRIEMIELSSKNENFEKELSKLQQQKRDEEEEMRKAYTYCHIETNMEEEFSTDSVLTTGIRRLAENLRESAWQRDTLERHVSSITQELRESNELLEEVQSAKGEAERDCEYLRDQLEELQKEVRNGVRPDPEGGNRGLPTIEEEETEAGTECCIEEQKEKILVSESNEASNDNQNSQIIALQSQVEALSEARRNLETEVRNLRSERDVLLEQLNLHREIEGRTGNLANLETEAISLRSVKESMEKQVFDLSKENRDLINGKILLEHRICDLIDASNQLRLEKDFIEQRVFELSEELSHVSEVLSQKEAEEVMNDHLEEDSQNVQIEYEESLNKLKTQLIYKEDKVDQLIKVLSEILSLYEIEYTDPEKVLYDVKSCHLELNNKYEDTKSNFDLLFKKNSILEARTNILENQIEMNKSELDNNLKDNEKYNKLISIRHDSKETEFSEIKIGFETLKQNSSDTVNSDLFIKNESHTAETERMTSAQLTEILKNKEIQVSQLEELIEKLRSEKHVSLALEQNEFCKHLNSEKTQLSKELSKLNEEKTLLLQKIENLIHENLEVMNKFESASLGHSQLNSQVVLLQGEREQMISTLTQKHQESVSYHTEIQRLTHILTLERQHTGLERASLESKIRDEKASLHESHELVENLRNEIKHFRDNQETLEKSLSEKESKLLGLADCRRELENLEKTKMTLEQERDQLRVANAHFNTQYQTQGKELSTLKERESRLAVECERLRQHLVEVEEHYTREALRAEERESTLRTTLTKMEEKISNHSQFYNTANQRASGKLGSLEEKVRQVTHERDEAVLRLHEVEQSCDQHQQAAQTLQQVLQDFQKGQLRDISEATAKERKLVEEEREKKCSLISELANLKTQLLEAQSGLAAASRLGEQLEKKERMVLALKSQITTQEDVLKKSREEMVCLMSSSDTKVDKPLLRNLLVGYFATPVDKRQEVLRIIATVLDFSQEERSRTGLDNHAGSWLSSIANFLAPPASNIRIASKVDVLDHTSLSQAFIRFLEDESNPLPVARLPAVQMAKQTEEKAEKKAQAKAATKINPFVSIGQTLSTNKDTSRNSSPLLAAASVPSVLPTFTPIASTLEYSNSNATTLSVISSNNEFTSSLSNGNISSLDIIKATSNSKFLSNLLSAENGGDIDNEIK